MLFNYIQSIILCTVLLFYQCDSISHVENCSWKEVTSNVSKQKFRDIKKWISKNKSGLPVCDVINPNRPNYEWECSSSTDQFQQKFEPNIFCNSLEKLGGYGILFIGDSISGLHKTTLGSLLNATYNMKKGYHEICDNKYRLGFTRNDYLTIGGLNSTKCKETKVKGSMDRCAPWASSKHIERYNIIVVNSGAHYHMKNNKTVNYDEHMLNAAKFISENANPSSLLIFRDTMPGHGNCKINQFSKPMESISEAEDYLKENPFYNGNEFKLYNKIAYKIFSSYGFKHLSTYNMTILRKDSHIVGKTNDCLHYCLPGPSIAWCDLLLEVMLKTIHENNLRKV